MNMMIKTHHAIMSTHPDSDQDLRETKEIKIASHTDRDTNLLNVQENDIKSEYG